MKFFLFFIYIYVIGLCSVSRLYTQNGGILKLEPTAGNDDNIGTKGANNEITLPLNNHLSVWDNDNLDTGHDCEGITLLLPGIMPHRRR